MKNLNRIITIPTRMLIVLCMMTIMSHTIIAQVSPSERQALIDFYNATDGDNWTSTVAGTQPWLINDTNSPVSEWFGVTVVEGKVEQINLVNNGLIGVIPNSIVQFSSLQRLVLLSNQISGSLPSEIGSLNNLNYLLLNDNKIEGGLPSSLGQLVNLRYLNFFDNNFTGTIPTEIGNMSSLENIDLGLNNLSGTIPESIGNLTSLISLKLASNEFSGTVPNIIGQLPNLRVVHLLTNQFTGEILNVFTQTQNLEQLAIRANRFVFSDFESDFNTIKSKLGSSFTYIPQFKVDETETLSVATNGTITLSSTTLTSPNNSYQWFRNNVAVPGAVSKDLVISNASDTDAGVYKFTATNSIVAGLTLERNPITLTVTPAVDTCGVSESQKQALIDLYNSTDGPNWTNSWDLNAPVCDWYGVTVVDGKITRLDLPNNKLEGMIPPSIGNLTDLIRINFAINKLTSLPDTFTNLVNVVIFTVERNAIAGSIPDSVGSMIALEMLNFGTNQLTGQIPPSLGDLNQLIQLNLFSNKLSGSIPSSLNNLTFLTHLNLFRNSLTGSIPDLSGLSSLIFFNLHYNQLEGAIPSSLGNLYNLTTIGLSTNRITGSIPSSLGNLSKLATITLDNNLLTGTIPSELGQLSELTLLNLYRNQLSGSIPSELGNLSKLQTLGLSTNQLSGLVPVNLISLVSSNVLNVLTLDQNSFVFSNFEAEFPTYKNDLTTFNYLTQAKVDEIETVSVAANGSVTLSSTALTSTNNGYQWYKDGVIIPEANNKDFVINEVSTRDAGVYHFTAGNNIITDLTLERNPITLTVTPAVDTCGVSEAEKQALIDLYNSTDGANWTNNTNWLTDAPVCDWFGVGVADGKVIILNLRQNKLAGPIPSSIEDLFGLVNINFYGNQLVGSIQVTLRKLLNLASLILTDNQLTGSIPSELGELLNLTDLSLGFNRLTGPIPLVLGSLSNLENLSLNGNQLTSNIPLELAGLTKLKRLNLFSNQLTGTIPQELGGLSDLVLIQLRNNKLQGVVPSTFANLSNLALLSFSDNEFVYSDFESEFNEYQTKLGANFKYAPQSKVEETETVSVAANGSVTLSSTALTSTNNGYQWYKDGVIIPEANNKDFVINEVSTRDAGVYHFTAGNSIVTGLTLERNPITLTVTPAVDTCGVSAAEKQALIDLYNSTDGPNWTNNTNWLTDAPVCDWYGITVVNEGVTRLDLGNNQLSGSIPSEIAQLSNLRNFRILNNEVTGTIPKEIAQLSNLDYLDFSANQLSGPIPLELGQLNKLIYLSLFGNKLEGNIPVEIGALLNLENLYLNDNLLTGVIPVEIGNLLNIKQLGLSANKLSGSIPVEFGQLSKLLNLDLRDNQLTGSIPNEIGLLQSLERLYLSNNFLTGNIPSEIGGIISLKFLRISDNQFTGSFPSSFVNLSNIFSIHAHNNQLSGRIPSGISQIESLISPGQFYFYNNEFVFTDFETEFDVYQNKLETNFKNSPQAKVDETETVSVAANGSVTLSSTALTSTNNGYQWYKDGVIIPEANNKDFVINEVSTRDAGVYHFTAGNSIVTGLTLERNPITLTVTPAVDTCGVSESEKQALVDLYNSTDGPNWTNNTNWLTDAPVCDWYGVTVEATGSISLDLGGNNLVGILNETIGELISLRQLILTDNKISGTIPVSILQLTNLERLYLVNNLLSGEIPLNIGVLQKLVYVHLGNNQLSGSIPISFDQLTNLKWLNLNGNQINGSLSTGLSNLAKLERLVLSNNQLTGPIPLNYGSFNRLKILALDYNQLSGNIPSEISNLNTLQQLFLNNNEISGSIPSELGNLSELALLTLDKNQLSGIIPVEFENLLKLNVLTFDYNQLSGEIPDFKSLNLSFLRNNNNQFVFSNFENEHISYQSNVSNYLYAPQAKVDETETVSVEQNGTITLSSTALTSSNNSYQWYKDGVAITGATSKDFVIEGASDSNAGVYHFTSTNSIITDLTLERNPITLTIGESICDEGVSESEKQALLDFYTATNGDNWTNTLANNMPWDPTVPVCNWYGVTIEDGKVTVLNLENNAVQGTIPSSISNLLYITSLELNTNALTGQIPSSMGALLELTYLSMHHNNLTGILPPSLGSLSNLVVMDLSFNNLQSEIPVGFCNLSKLEILNLSDNQLSSSIPKQLGILSRLKRIDLRNNMFIGAIPSELRSLSNLEYFGLSNNQLSSSIPIISSEFSKLEEFVFENNNFIFSNFENRHVAYTNYVNTAYQYAPQAKTDLIETKTVTTGNPIILTTVLSSENNSYQWYKDGVAIQDATSETYDIQSASVDDAGVYYFTATNSVITELTLERNPITLAVKETCSVSAAQREALVTLYNTLGGSNWSNTLANNQVWDVNNPDSSVCDWYGVTVENNDIVALNLANNNVIGVLPDVFNPLLTIRTLNLQNNSLEGELPFSLVSKFSKIELLEIQNNNFVFLDIVTVYPGLFSLLADQFVYTPQAKVDVSTTESVEFGTDFPLPDTELTDSNNEYQWYKNGLPIDGATSKEYIISNASSENNGMYFFEATNTVVKGLTLTRNPIKVEVRNEGDTCGVSAEEKQALIDLYNSTDGANWTNNTNWLTDTPVCDWYGVTVQDHKIISLDLKNNNLEGNIPPSILDLVNITFLNFVNSNFSGTSIPPQIGSLTNLRYLNLGGSKLEGAIPSEIGNLINLKFLHLNTNQLTSSLPRSIGNLKNLEGLYLYSNSISGNIPLEIGNMDSLINLYLTSNKLSGNLPIQIGQLSNLSILYLGDNDLEGNIPTEITNLNNLRFLHLQNNQLSGQIPAQMGNMQNLEVLYINNNDLQGEVPISIGDLSRIRIIELQKNNLSGNIPAQISDISTLINFTFDNNAFLFSDFEYEHIIYTGYNKYGYAPQAKVDEVETRSVEYGKETRLSSTALTSENNSYQWYKDEVLIVGATNKELIITDAGDEDAGVYYFTATNSIITDLTLTRNPITLVLKAAGTCDVSAEARQALIDFYKSTSGDAWINTVDGNQTWLINDPISKVCDWYGVTLDADYKVTKIELSNNNLRGEIPNSLQILDDLEVLNLGKNKIVGEIPSFIGSFSEMEVLNLRENIIVGIIPKEITFLSNLITLDLGVNRLSATIPEGIEVSRMQYLDLSYNKLEGTLPESLYGSNHLSNIKLQNNNLTGRISKNIGDVYRLQVLWLSNNSFSGSIPQSVSKLLSLYSIHLDNNNFENDLPLLIPNIGILPSSDVQINNNRFVFSDFESEHPDYRDNLTNYEYIPQALVDKSLNIVVELGDSARLFTDDLTSTNNTYRWFKDGEFLIETTDREVLINTITEDDLGTYYFEATNSVIERLTLVRRTITIKLKEDNTDGTDCNNLEGGSFEDCRLIASTTIRGAYNNTIDCSNWEPLDVNNSPSTWVFGVGKGEVIDDNVVINTPEMSNKVQKSPDGGVFTSSLTIITPVEQGPNTDPRSTHTASSQGFKKKLSDLVIGATYTVSYYQSHGGGGLLSANEIRLDSMTTYWQVSIDNRIIFGNFIKIPLTQELSNTPVWEKVERTFKAQASEQVLTFKPSPTLLVRELEGPFYFNLLIDGIKVTKVDGDCGGDDIAQQEFCTSNGAITIADLQSPFPNTEAIWSRTELDKALVSLSTVLSETSIWWAQTRDGSQIGRTPVRIIITNPPLADRLQEFDQTPVPTVADLRPAGSFFNWYLSEDSDVALASDTVLQNNRNYYVAQGDNFCRLEVLVKINTGGVDTVFCSAQESRSIGDLESPIDGVSDVTWYLSETGGIPLLSDFEILDSFTFWAQGNVGEPRVSLAVDIYNGITGFDVQDYEYQAFSLISDSKISDLGPLGQNIVWYSTAIGGIPIPVTDSLINGTSYYGQQGVNPCRFEVFVFVGVLEPDGFNTQEFCASNNPTILDLKDRLIEEAMHKIIFYTDETGSTEYNDTDLLVDEQIIYVVQRDDNGNESTRKRINIDLNVIPPPIVSSTEQIFYSNDPVFISDLGATGMHIVWFDDLDGGTAYDPGYTLTSGETYYAAQTDFACETLGVECCVSIDRIAVTVTILEEVPPTLIGCERFRPQPGDRYVISGWVRENGVKAVDPREQLFSEVSSLFVDMLNDLFQNKIFSRTALEHSFPSVKDNPEKNRYVVENREYDKIIPYVKNNVDKNLTIYNFKYIKERQQGVGPLRTVGFSFALEPSDNAERFSYKTPYIRVNTVESPGFGRYPLFQNSVLGNTANNEFSLRFTDVNFCGSQLCLTSSFNIVGLSTSLRPVSYSYTGNNIINTDFGNGIIKQYTVSSYLIDPNYQVQDYENSLMSVQYAMTNDDGDLLPLEDQTVEFLPKGAIIDGWQRISADFTIPIDATDMQISLKTNPANNPNIDINAYFDDLRIHPFDGNMKSFVYDPVTQRLQAELDENNYATFYEYDQEGGLIRVKKETERGVYTIQETRSGNSKLNNQD